MADVKISALPASTTPLAGTEVLPIVQSGVTKQVSVANLTAGRAVSASTLTATDLKTSPTTANLDISGTTIAAGGTDSNIDVNINAKGTGIAYLNQKWGVNASGTLVPASGNTYDIGNGLSNPRDVNVDRYVVLNGATASKAVFTDASKNLTTTGTVGTAQGGTGLTSFTANGLVYASSTSALTTGSNLTYDGTNLALTSGALNLTGNQSSAAWTTTGIKLKGGGSTLTDTSSSGTVAAAYTNVLGGNTIAASNATTYTDYISTYISDPVAGANVTITNKWSFGTQGAIKSGGVVNAPGYQLESGGIITESGTTRTLSATDNGKVIYCTSGSAVTINCASGLGAGFSVTIIQGGAGKVTVAANGQTLVSYSSLFSTMGQYAVISLICPVANTFVAAGNLGV